MATTSSSKPQFQPRRGDIVSYGGRAYYFQPNGNSCYLYLRKEDIGKTSLASFVPRRTALSAPSSGLQSLTNPFPSSAPVPLSGGMDELVEAMNRLSLAQSQSRSTGPVKSEPFAKKRSTSPEREGAGDALAT